MTNKETAIQLFRDLLDRLEKSGDACITSVEVMNHSRTVPDPNRPFEWIEEPTGEKTLNVSVWFGGVQP